MNGERDGALENIEDGGMQYLSVIITHANGAEFAEQDWKLTILSRGQSIQNSVMK